MWNALLHRFDEHESQNQDIAYAPPGGWTWEHLQPFFRVVVLGEARTGKTAEFQARVSSLTDNGIPAFFFRLEELVVNSVEVSLDNKSLKVFQDWLDSDHEAFLFLDSVDEARLKVSNLETVFKKLRYFLGKTLSRIHIFISCRVSDWKVDKDAQALKVLDPQIANVTCDVFMPLVVQFVPLDRVQIQILIRARDPGLVSTITEALDNADAWHFVNRPGDVLWLLAYWGRTQRLGSLLELMKNNVKEKLKEFNEEHDPNITSDRTHIGVKRLAAACLLCRKSAIIVPGESWDVERLAEGLSAEEVLSGDFKTCEIKSVLNCAVFDVATYGRVRFHHRSVQEYLCAEWLYDRLKAGCPWELIEPLLFQKKYGQCFAVPSMAGVLGWLACLDLDKETLERTFATAPDTLLYYGDPQVLPADMRRTLLRKIVAMLGRGPATSLMLAAAAIRPLTDPEFSVEINEHLLSSSAPDHVKLFLLNLVREGRVAKCARTAALMAMTETLGSNLRSVALNASAVAGSEAERKELAQWLSTNTARHPIDLVGQAIQSLYPTAMDNDTLMAIIESCSPEEHFGYDLLKAIEASPAESSKKLFDLLPLLVNLIGSQGRTTPTNQHAHVWLIRPLTGLIARIFNLPKFPEVLEASSFAAIDLVLTFTTWNAHHGDELRRITCILERQPHLRRRLFWHSVKRHFAVQRDPPTHLSQLAGFSEMWTIGVQDFDWLLDDFPHKATGEKRAALLGLHAAWVSRRRNAQDLEKINALVAEDLNLHREVGGWSEPEDPMTLSRISPTPPNFMVDFRCKETLRLLGSLGSADSGVRLSALSELSEAMLDPLHDKHRGNARLEVLWERYGCKVAGAAHDGFVQFWRDSNPPFPCELEGSLHSLAQFFVGLTGLAIVAQERGLSSFSPEEAEAATRYALHEPNGFPDWFPDLLASHREIVVSVFRQAFECELQAHGEHTNTCNCCMARRLINEDDLRDEIAPSMLMALEKNPPARSKAVVHAIELLSVANQVDREKLAQLSFHYGCSAGMESDVFAQCFIVLLRLNSAKAADLLEQQVENSSFDSRAKLVDMLHCSAPGVLDQLSVDNLIRLIPLVWGITRTNSAPHQPVVWVGRNEDVDFWRRMESDPPMGVGFREGLLRRLGDIEGEEAYLALQKLADDPRCEIDRERFLAVARARAMQDGELPAWELSDVRAFETCFETEPTSAAGLYSIAMYRLSDMKNDVEGGDFSLRGFFGKGTHEEDMQKWVAYWLDKLSRRRYVVVREREVDNKKRPDITLQHSGSGASVCIEIKIAQFWTLGQLKEALNEQLVRKYLRARESRHGILLLALTHPHRWEAPGTSGLTFRKLVENLHAIAQEIKNSSSNVEDIAVIGIDFTTPSRDSLSMASSTKR